MSKDAAEHAIDESAAIEHGMKEKLQNSLRPVKFIKKVWMLISMNGADGNRAT